MEDHKLKLEKRLVGNMHIKKASCLKTEAFKIQNTERLAKFFTQYFAHIAFR